MKWIWTTALQFFTHQTLFFAENDSKHLHVGNTWHVLYTHCRRDLRIRTLSGLGTVSTRSIEPSLWCPCWPHRSWRSCRSLAANDRCELRASDRQNSSPDPAARSTSTSCASRLSLHRQSFHFYTRVRRFFSTQIQQTVDCNPVLFELTRHSFGDIIATFPEDTKSSNEPLKCVHTQWNCFRTQFIID